MFLTDNQRHYYNTMKKLTNRKPQKTIRRPKVSIIGLDMWPRFMLLLSVWLSWNFRTGSRASSMIWQQTQSLR